MMETSETSETENVIREWALDFGVALTYRALDALVARIEDHIESGGKPSKFSARR